MGDWNRVHRACKEALNIEVNDMFEVSEVIENLASDKEALQQQLILSGVSQQRELLKAYEMFVNKDAYNKLEDPINKIIEKFLSFNCG